MSALFNGTNFWPFPSESIPIVIVLVVKTLFFIVAWLLFTYARISNDVLAGKLVMVTEVPAGGIEKLAPRKMSLSVPTIQSSAFVNFSPGADSEVKPVLMGLKQLQIYVALQMIHL